MTQLWIVTSNQGYDIDEKLNMASTNDYGGWGPLKLAKP